MGLKRLVVVFCVALVVLVVRCEGGPFRNRDALLSYLNSISGKHTISGQYIQFGPLDPINDIHKNTGKWLGLVGGDYWWYGSTSYYATYDWNQHAIQYWNAGGIVTLTCHFANPTTGGGCYDVSWLDANALVTTGTQTNTNFNTILDSIAQGIQQLQKAGVVVIFRPFHELNGDWFWWGTKFISNQQFMDLWRYMHYHFTQQWGLDNIVWLYAVNAWNGNIGARYPGNDYVDIMGLDLYTNNPASDKADYDALVGFGKPVCLAEFGAGGPNGGDLNFNESTLISAIQTTMPKIVLWQQWWDGNGGNVGWGMAEVKDAAAALNNPWVLNRGDF